MVLSEIYKTTSNQEAQWASGLPLRLTRNNCFATYPTWRSVRTFSALELYYGMYCETLDLNIAQTVKNYYHRVSARRNIQDKAKRDEHQDDQDSHPSKKQKKGDDRTGTSKGDWAEVAANPRKDPPEQKKSTKRGTSTYKGKKIAPWWRDGKKRDPKDDGKDKKSDLSKAPK